MMICPNDTDILLCCQKERKNIMITTIDCRVLRQIFQSMKIIVDVILLLFFAVGFFGLIGGFLSEYDYLVFSILNYL